MKSHPLRRLDETPKRSFGRTLFLGIVLAFVGLCILPVALFLFGPEFMARRLAPPQFPGSILVDQQLGGGPTSVWDRRTLRTEATVERVVAFMDYYMPEFAHVDYAPAEQGAYRSFACDDGALSRWLAWSINGGHYSWYTPYNVPLPCVGVTVYVAPNDPALTEYQISVDWPAP